MSIQNWESLKATIYKQADSTPDLLEALASMNDIEVPAFNRTGLMFTICSRRSQSSFKVRGIGSHYRRQTCLLSSRQNTYIY